MIAADSNHAVVPADPMPAYLDADIAALDLEAAAFLIAMEQGWPLEKIDAVEREYRDFLQAARDFPGEPIAPSRDCDIFWHAHIMNLGPYLKQTQQLFGAPLIHYPFAGCFDEIDAGRQQERFQKSRQLLAGIPARKRTHRVEVE